MNGKVKLLIGILIFALIMGGAYWAYQKFGEEYTPDALATGETDGENLNPGDNRAPDFTVFDRDGNPVRLSDFFGKKPVVLNFWASYCPPCRAEMPDFDAAYEKYGDDVRFLIVNLTDGYRETVKKAAEFIDLQGYSFPVYFDSRGEAAAAYAVNSIPKTFFIDKYGVVAARADSMLGPNDLKKGIETITRIR